MNVWGYKMGYAIVGYFDKTSDEKIRALWKVLADMGVDDYLINSENNPHIKFAMFNSINLLQAQNELLLLSKRLEKIKIHFKKYGMYPSDKPFITIDIADNNEILKLHMEIQNIFNQICETDGRGYFDIGIWKPDCQLTVSFDKIKLATAMDYLVDTSMPFNGKLERIGLIEYHPAKQLFTYPLC
jgi:hypothetical protein